jgi:hypothetical protein
MDSTELEDEISALQSIYESSLKVELGENDSTVILYLDGETGSSIRFEVPPDYPLQQSPVFTVSFRAKVGSAQKEDTVARINEEININSQQVCLFAAIEKFRECINSRECLDESKDEHSTDCQPTTEHDMGEQILVTVIHGPVMVEQKSSFQAHIAAVHSMEEVMQFKRIVLSDKKIARATHNIFAYRFTCPRGTGVIYHDCDDDGETAAAGRVAEMIRLMGIDGVAVIVSRWFGGILLGPDRFKFICNAARTLLEDNGYGKGSKK